VGGRLNNSSVMKGPPQQLHCAPGGGGGGLKYVCSFHGAFDSGWVPPVGGAPSRRTSTGGATTGLQSPVPEATQVLGTRESGSAPSRLNRVSAARVEGFVGFLGERQEGRAGPGGGLPLLGPVSEGVCGSPEVAPTPEPSGRAPA
jgi:hypothetical protein